MKGKDLIKWIQDNKAEDLDIFTQARNSGGYYREYLPLEPCVNKKPITIDINETGHPVKSMDKEGIYLSEFVSL